MLYLPFTIILRIEGMNMDVLTEPMSKEEELIRKVLESWVAKNGYAEIKANIEGYETPPGLSNKDVVLIPDISAMKRGARWYIEIVRKDAEPIQTVSKWKLFSQIGKNKGGGLILIAPSGSYAFAERLTRQHDIAVQIVKL